MVGRISSPRFVGRRDELAVLEAALERAADGLGSAVLVAGEAGIGKSRLLSALAEGASRSDATVLVGECLPLAEGEIPFAPIAGVLRSLLRQRGLAAFGAVTERGHGELARVLPELGTGGEPDGDAAVHLASGRGAETRLFDQLFAVLTAAARAAPLVLIVEDLQWADRSTCDFLTFLVRAVRDERMMLVTSYRSDEPYRATWLGQFVHELERSGRATRIELGPLTRAELREQVEAILGADLEPPMLDRLLERCEGNPFFAEELLAESTSATALPDSLKAALLLRVERCSAASQRVLRVVATAAKAIDHRLLAEVAGFPAEELRAAIRGAVDSHVLAHPAAAPSYSFRHALFREAVYADLLPDERRELHVALARALSAHPELAGSGAARAAELAHHWHAAGESSHALAASLDAADAAEEMCAPAEALLQYERALQLWEVGAVGGRGLSVDRPDVLRRAAEAAHLSGAIDRSVALARERIASIVAAHEPRVAALAHERLGHYLWTAGHGEDALPEYRRAVELMPSDPPSAAAALVLAAHAQVLMQLSRTRESTTRCEEALAMARAVGATSVQAHVLNTMSGNLSARGEQDAAIARAAEARTIARSLGLAEEVGRGYLNGSSALEHAGRIEEAHALAAEGSIAARELGAEHEFGAFLGGETAGRLLRGGRWDEAQERLGPLLDREPVGLALANALGYQGQLHADRGQLEAAFGVLGRAAAIVRVGQSMWLGPLAEAQATAELWAERPQRAATVVATSLEQLSGHEEVYSTARLYELGIRACADLAARAPADIDATEHQAAVADALIERLDLLIAQLTGATPPRVQATRAAAAAERGRIDGGDAERWALARREWDACGDPYQSAYAGWREAEAILARSGDRGHAAGPLRAAHAVASALSAGPLLTELDALARRARIDVPTGLDSRPSPVDSQLTPRELEVLHLIAEGMTNREIASRLFISHKTASAHVSHILAKLDVPNRVAAAASARAIGSPRD